MKLLQLVVTAISIFVSHPILFADEIWTYRFVVDGSLPYRVDCGECGPPLLGSRADVSGTFSILLDWQNLTGRLLELNDQLVNIHNVESSPSGPILRPATPSEWHDGIFSAHHPPTPAEGPFIFTGGLWQVSASNFSLAYEIRFDWNQATFNMTVPIMDAYVTVTNARATFVSAVIAGDHNYDGIVDAADYVVWRKLNLSNYQFWRESFTSSVSSGGGGTAAPEANAIVLVSVGCSTCLLRRVRRCRGRVVRQRLN
jgi:hypothetical protein